MSFLAAASGAKVYSYEPNPLVFQGLETNAVLNQNLGVPIQIFNKAVSRNSGTLELEAKHSNQVLSPIVFTHWQDKSTVEVVALTEILKSFDAEFGKEFRTVIKIDIEGAEWEILRDLRTLEELKSNQSVLILALHPGLHRPPNNISSIIGRLSFYLWNLHNIVDSWLLFKRVSSYCSIYRTNLNPVKRPLKFCLLVLAGNHEYVFSFRKEL